MRPLKQEPVKVPKSSGCARKKTVNTKKIKIKIILFQFDFNCSLNIPSKLIATVIKNIQILPDALGFQTTVCSQTAYETSSEYSNLVSNGIHYCEHEAKKS